MTTNTRSSILQTGTPSKAVYGSDLMVEVLRALGIEYIALNPGASYRGLHDSIVNFGDGPSPEMILCTHEEIAVAIANGYALATGKTMATGLHNVVGLQHAAMAIFNAWCDRTPILNLGGGGPQNAVNRRSTDWVHTALVQGTFVQDIVKFHDQPYSIDAAPESLLRAYRIANTYPKGPVYVCLDSDVQEDRVEGAMVVPDVALYQPPAPPAADPDALRRAASLLVNAEWPVIVPGETGRNHSAVASLRQLAEVLGAPVVDAGGPFNFPNTHPLNLTDAREDALRDADVILALDVPSLGVPLGPSVRERGPLQPAVRPDAKIIHITLFDLQDQSWVTDAMWLFPVAVPIAGDTAQALPELVSLCRDGLAKTRTAAANVDRRRAKIEGLHHAARAKGDAWVQQNLNVKPISGARLFTELKDRIGGHPWALVHSHGAGMRHILDLVEPGHGIGGGRGAGVGYGPPSSVGAALGLRDTGKLCVSAVGDGDFLMTSNALWTAAHHRIPLLTIVYNNRSYYNDEEHQERIALRRERPVENKGIGIHIDDPAPDMATIARGLGVEGFGPVTEPDQVGRALDEALRAVRDGRPALVDVITQAR